MPRRRRTPAQRAASRRNLEKARAAKKSKAQRKVAQFAKEGRKPQGKKVLLYHRTSPTNAKSIVAQGFNPGKAVKSNLSRSKVDRSVFFSDKPFGEASRYGKALLSVKVPRRKVKRDWNYEPYKGETFYHVRTKDLKGRKVKRIL